MKIFHSLLFEKRTFSIMNSSIKTFARQVYKADIHKPVLGSFNKDTSIYKYNEVITEEEIKNRQKSVPKYLVQGDTTGTLKEKYKVSTNSNLGKSEKKIIERALKPGKKMVLAKPEFQRKPKKEVLIKEKRERRNIEFEMKNYKLLSKEDRRFLNNSEWSTNRNNIEYVKLEKQKLGFELNQQKQLIETKKKEYFNTELFDKEFNNDERLSKRLSKLGVCSRRQAEKLIEKGMVKVDGKNVFSNVPVNLETNIQIYTKKGYQMPFNESVKIWAFYKPQGYVCTSKDIRNRPTIYQVLASKGFDRHLIPIAPLDYSAEGLLLLTNSGEMSSLMEKNKSLERVSLLLIRI